MDYASTQPRAYSYKGQFAETPAKLGGSDKLAGILQYLLEADLRRCPPGRYDRCRSAGRGAGDHGCGRQAHADFQIRSEDWVLQSLVAEHDTLANCRSTA